ncbi:flagellar basal body-associated FliL family protein [Pseudogemmobacter humi]|uniref:Flagellar protein FliL n=1 Tax=Pseudogemmobacter humi TaxID=2483812 RepID=A0A3P5WP40_9RHOB|nr:flagellar basal body-associated FliL family protein [Pseudogemmobacter humi]VDC20326.1 Flagellar basal body-associated protein FliL [Pseudogemmobacter humi]
MMRKILPLLIAIIGLAAGAGAGLMLRKPAEEPDPAAGAAPAVPDPALVEYVKLNNQFIVPVLEGGRVASLVAMSLSLEIATGNSEQVFAREPKLRDAFLQVMFDHANTGGFRGSFTDAANLVVLRRALMEQAKLIMGNVVSDVLITEIARQDS